MSLAQTCPEHDALPGREVISGTGVGTRSIEATIGVVNLAIQIEEMTAVKAHDELSKASTKLETYLREQKVTELAASRISITSQKQEFAVLSSGPGHKGKASFTFEVAARESGRVIGGAIAAGASEVTEVTFRGTQETRLAARMEAVADAVSYAKAEAESAVAKLDMKLGKTVKVQITDKLSADPSKAPTKHAEMPGFIASEQPNVGGGQKITATVTAFFELS